MEVLTEVEVCNVEALERGNMDNGEGLEAEDEGATYRCERRVVTRLASREIGILARGRIQMTGYLHLARGCSDILSVGGQVRGLELTFAGSE